MTHQPKTDRDQPSPSGLQEEIHMLRDLNRHVYALFKECKSLQDRIRYLATLSMSYTRVGTLLKLERMLSGADDYHILLDAKLDEVLGKEETEGEE